MKLVKGTREKLNFLRHNKNREVLVVDKKNKLGLQYDPDGDKVTNQQLSESYQSGVIDNDVEGRKVRQHPKRKG